LCVLKLFIPGPPILVESDTDGDGLADSFEEFGRQKKYEQQIRH
jgi:hypothetical protein